MSWYEGKFIARIQISCATAPEAIFFLKKGGSELNGQKKTLASIFSIKKVYCSSSRDTPVNFPKTTVGIHAPFTISSPSGFIVNPGIISKQLR